jgi:hypothetical protein
MAQIVRQTMSRHDDARSLLRAVYSTEVDFIPDQKAKPLTVRPRSGDLNELKPHLKTQWVIPPEANGAFVAAMEDVLSVYTRPHDPDRPLVCLNETTKQLKAGRGGAVRRVRLPEKWLTTRHCCRRVMIAVRLVGSLSQNWLRPCAGPGFGS